ncbi:MAG: hypothetical protein NC332_00500 [Firmicutes bacterium]|nr:hypothetical protein [Bacillota bacterium]
MNDKAKLIALSGVCAAVAVGCLALAGFVKWVVLICAAIASVAVAVPVLLDCRNWIYSVLILIVSGALGLFIGIANVLYVMPIVAFCMPFSIVKAYGESLKVTASLQEGEVLEDPFNQGDDRTVFAVKLDGKTCLPKAVKWILYFVLLEVALGLTVLFVYLFTKDVFNALVESKAIYWLLGAAQLVVVPYDLLMRGCFIGTVKIMRRAHLS